MKVTVLVLVYNHENYITKCLDGIFAQLGIEQCKIVINDDASTDNSANIIQKYIADKTENITYIRRIKNIGAKNSLLEMLNVVDTDYITIIEGDDYWIDNNKLQDQMKILDEDTKLSAVHGKSIIVDENNLKTGDMNVAGNVSLELFIQKNNVPLNTMMFRNFRELFDEKYYASEIICDIPLKILILSKGNSALLDRNVTAYRYITNGGSSFSSMKSNYQKTQTYLALIGVKTICENNIYYKRWLSKFLISSGRKKEFIKFFFSMQLDEKINIFIHLFKLKFSKKYFSSNA